MRFEIREDVIASATQCEKDIACLHSADHVYCTVENCLMHRVPYVRCRNEEPCVYKGDLEGSHICMCPIRKEIFNRYGE